MITELINQMKDAYERNEVENCETYTTYISPKLLYEYTGHIVTEEEIDEFKKIANDILVGSWNIKQYN